MKRTKKRLLKNLILPLFLLMTYSMSLTGQSSAAPDSLKINEANKYRDRGFNFLENGVGDSATHYFEIAYDLYRQIEDTIGITGMVETRLYSSYNDYYNAKNYDRMIRHAKEGFEMAQKHIPKNTYLISLSYQLMSAYYHLVGDNHAAIEIATSASKMEDDELNIAVSYNNLGAMYSGIKDFELARMYLQRAVDIYLNNIDSLMPGEISTLYNNLGNTYFREKKWNEALTYYDKSIAYVPTENEIPFQENFVNSYLSIANTYRQMGDFEKSYSFAIEAEAFGKKYNYNTDQIPNVIGHAYQANKNYQEAISYYKKAINTARAEFGYRNPKTIRHYRAIGSCYFEKNDLKSSLIWLQQGLAAGSKVDSLDFTQNPDIEDIHFPEILIEVLAEKANTLKKYSGEHPSYLKAALSTYDLIIRLMEKQKQHFMFGTAKEFMSNRMAHIYEGAILTAWRLYSKEKDADYFDIAFAFSEKYKSRLLLENIKDSKGKIEVNIPDSLISKERALAIEIAFYEKKIFDLKQQSDSSNLSDFENVLFDKKTAFKELKQSLETTYPKYYNLKYETAVPDPKTIQNTLLENGDCLIEYFVGEDDIYIFSISKDSVLFEKLPMTESFTSITSSLITALNSLEYFEKDALESAKAYKNNAYSLYQMILEKHLTHHSSIKRLVIIPDKSLNYIPLEAIISSETFNEEEAYLSLEYLINDYIINYSYSASMLAENKEQSKLLPSSKDCLAFTPESEHYSNNGSDNEIENTRVNNRPLKGAVEEVKKIAEYFDGHFEIGEDAKEEKFKEIAGNYGIIHLAMHGFMDAENERYSKLQFSNKDNHETPDEDNYLYNYEIQNLSLQAHLVVLSACETGSGKFVRGEGVKSLARSFMHAGVPSVIMSLWKLNDHTTGRIVPNFYKELAKGEKKDVALREAKLEYLKNADAITSHPYYWSGLVFIGDNQHLTGGGGFWYYGVLLLVLIILLSFYLRRRR